MIAGMVACGLFALTLCAPGMVFALRTNRPVEETLPLTACGIILLLYLSGLCGVLPVGAYGILALALACYGYAAVYMLIKRVPLSVLLKRVCTPAMALFAILFAVAVVCNYGRMPYHGDEFSHWAYAVKAMTHTGRFAADPTSGALYGSYPPGIQLLQYYMQKLNGLLAGANAYADWLLYVPYQTLAFTLMLPVLSKFGWRDAAAAGLLGAACFLLPMALFPLFYESAFPEPILGLLTGYCLLLIWCTESVDGFTQASVCLLLVAITLSKDVGLFFALLCCGVLLVRIWGKNRQGVQRRSAGQRIVQSLYAPLSIVAAKLSWSGLLAAYATPVRGSSQTVQFADVWAFLSGRDISATGYRMDTLFALGKRFFGPGCPFGTTGFTLFGKTIPVPGFSVSYLLVVCLLLGALLFAALYQPRRLGVFFVLLGGTAAYLLGIVGLYLFAFYDFEALELWCFDRYIGVPLMMLASLALMLLACRLGTQAAEKPQRSWRSWIAPLAVLIGVSLLCPLQNLKTYLTRESANGSAKMLEAEVALAGRVTKLAGPDDKVFLIEQGSDGEGIALRYLLYPKLIDGASIGQKWYPDDSFARDISADAWRELLLDGGYAYVVLHRLDAHFIQTCASAFVDPQFIDERAIYAVDAQTGMLSVIP